MASISETSAGANCTIWVAEGIQCGGQVALLAKPRDLHLFHICIVITGSICSYMYSCCCPCIEDGSVHVNSLSVGVGEQCTGLEACCSYIV